MFRRRSTVAVIRAWYVAASACLAVSFVAICCWSGVAKIVDSTGHTGLFWFFEPANVELLIKVLDGRALNDAFWVYWGSASNVAYTVTVTDTATGEPKVYQNGLGTFGSGGDVEAFPQ